MTETPVYKGITHLSFGPLQQIYNLINEQVQDINGVRSSETDLKKRQWIYAAFPESDDENYPRVAIINDDIRFEEYGDGQFVSYDKDNSGNVTHINYGKVAIMPISITVFVKKRQQHSVTYYDGSVNNIQNGKQADFIGEKIAKFLEVYESQYFIPYNMNIEVKSVSKSYDDNDFLIAKTIECEVVLMDSWIDDLTSQDANEKTIREIDENVTVNPQ